MTDILALAAEIRRVDGKHSLGAAALAEALEPYLDAVVAAVQGDVEDEMTERAFKYGVMRYEAGRADERRKVLDELEEQLNFQDTLGDIWNWLTDQRGNDD